MTYRDAYDKLIVQAIEIRDSSPDGGEHTQYMSDAIHRMKLARDNLSPLISRMEYVPIPM